MTKKFKLTIKDELTILQMNLEKLEYSINVARREINQAQETLNYITQKLQKLINRYKPKTKTVNLQPREAEEK